VDGLGRAAGLACVIIGAGCLSTPPPARDEDATGIDAAVDASLVDAPTGPCRDEDGDGWPTGACEGVTWFDCADGDAARHPGASESVGDADLDCDGAGLTAGEALGGLAATPAGQGRRIAGPIATVTLDDAAGFGFRELRLGAGSDLAYTGQTPERTSGVEVWEDWFTQAPDSAMLTPVLEGIAVAQYRITWTAGGMNGTSLLTFHRDGRIVRGDDFDITGTVASPAPHFVSAFVSLRGEAVDRGDWDGNEGPPAETSNSKARFLFASSAARTDWVCLYRDGGTDVVGMAAVVPDDGQPRVGLRITEATTVGPTTYRQVGLQYDWQRSSGSVDTGHRHGNVLIVPTHPDAAPCARVATAARAFVAPATMVVDLPGRRLTDLPGDDDDDGYLEQGGYWALAVGDSGAGHLRFTASVAADQGAPPSSTFRIYGVAVDPAPVVTWNQQRLVRNRQYLLQVDGVSGAWLHLAQPLGPGDVVEIIPAPGVPAS
jgi:hypothetical protein